jgi:hypothetical protein
MNPTSAVKPANITRGFISPTKSERHVVKPRLEDNGKRMVGIAAVFMSALSTPAAFAVAKSKTGRG